MTLRTHVYAVRNLMSKGAASDDTSFSLRLIAHFLRITRGMLIEQKANKYHSISEQSYQSLCLNLEESNYHNCCEGPDTKCKLLRSTIKLPRFLTTRWGDLTKVMTLDGKVLSKTSMSTNKFSRYSLTNSDPKPGWFIHDNYLYIINNKHLQKVLLNSLFDNPEEIDSINCSSAETPCVEFLETEFPVDSELIPPMYELTMKFLVNSLALPPKDNENDAKDNQTA